MNEKRSDNLIFEAYQQINEWGGDLDPANNPLDALKHRIADNKGQNPRVTARYAREVVDQILHMGKAVSAEKVEQVLRSQIQDVSGLGGPFNAQGRQERPLFDEELIKYIMTPFEDKHDDGSDRGRTAWEPADDSSPRNREVARRASLGGAYRPDEENLDFQARDRD